MRRAGHESSSGSDMRALPPGTVIGNYRVTSLIGKGGMGVVYAAEHTRLGRKSALKVLRPEFAEDATIVKRFFDEARAANKVGNEHIVEIFDFIEAPGVRAYVMELLDGKPLSKRIGNLNRDETLNIARQMAEALAAVHTAGIVHRHDEGVEVGQLGGERVREVRRERGDAALPRHVVAEQGNGANDTGGVEGVDGCLRSSAR